MNEPKPPRATGPEDSRATESPARRPERPSPPERHPGKKPEEADGRFADLQIRESGNRREPD